MINFKLDIEERIWTYVETESAIKSFMDVFSIISMQEWADREFKDCIRIDDTSNPIVKLCFEISDSLNLNVDLKIFEGGHCNIQNVLGCAPGNGFIYFFYQHRLIKHLELSEISLMLMHEFGHYHFRNNYNPEKIATHPFYYFSAPSEDDHIRFGTIAFLLSHISEYKADLFAAFKNKDIQRYKKAILKLYKIEMDQNPNCVSIEERRTQIDIDWKKKFKSSHPFIEDRIAFLDCIEKYIHDTSFDINQTPEVYNKVLELLSYNEFIKEYGEYYEEKLKSVK